MNIGSKTRRAALREIALAVLGLPVGVVLWFVVLYTTALLVGHWKETHFTLVRAVIVIVEIAAIVALMWSAFRMREGRGVVVGVLLSFATVTLLFWTGWRPA